MQHVCGEAYYSIMDSLLEYSKQTVLYGSNVLLVSTIRCESNIQRYKAQRTLSKQANDTISSAFDSNRKAFPYTDSAFIKFALKLTLEMKKSPD